jgi:hypothetical protein
MKSDTPHPDDPFAGYDPQPVRCRWLDADNERRAATADIVRLVVDENRRAMHWPNDVYQRDLLEGVSAFLGPTRKVIVTPAGLLTLTTGDDHCSLLGGRLRRMETVLASINLGESSHEFFVGVDDCVPGASTPVQTVVYCPANSIRMTEQTTTIKLYPTPEEWSSLVGWRMVCAANGIPPELTVARRVSSTAGLFVVLVCNDACVFSGRSRSNLTDETGLLVREHFVNSLRQEPRPEFVLLATSTVSLA